MINMAKQKVNPSQTSGTDWYKYIPGASYSIANNGTANLSTANTSGNPIELKVEISSGTSGPELVYYAHLTAGTYKWVHYGDQDINRGIYTFYMDGTQVGSTFDGYAGSRANGAVFSVSTGFTVATTGLHEIKVKATSKNGSSSGYNLVIYGEYLTRTS